MQLLRKKSAVNDVFTAGMFILVDLLAHLVAGAAAAGSTLR
jgi:hypothetical protein